MAPSTTDPTFESNVTANATDQSSEPNTKAAGNGKPTAAPTHDYRDRLSYEDKWIGWDGPVWCNRYGRFEDKEQAAEDDGYKSDGPTGHQDSEAHTGQPDGCASEVPVRHHSYVQDIKRRIEPMTASLVALEHQVGILVHHMVKEGKLAAHEAFNNEDGKERFQMHTANGHQADGPFHAEHFEKHRDPMVETIAKLEGKVHRLQHQLHALEKQNAEWARKGQAGPAEHNYWQVSQ